MTSVIIAAYNEAAVIGRNLDRLLAGTAPGELEVVVVANGCVDATVAVASARDVRVLDLPAPGKAAALNAGDAVATSTPRVYLDADIATTPATVRALAAALTQPRPRRLTGPARRRPGPAPRPDRPARWPSAATTPSSRGCRPRGRASTVGA